MFDSRYIDLETDGLISADENRTVELKTLFKRVRCYKCDSTHVYKFRVKELRKILPADAEAPADTIMDTVPRYAQIPETVRCSDCGEVLGLYTECIY